MSSIGRADVAISKWRYYVNTIEWHFRLSVFVIELMISLFMKPSTP